VVTNGTDAERDVVRSPNARNPDEASTSGTPAPGRSDKPTTNEPLWRVIGPFVAGQRARLASLSVMAAVGSFAEAGVLVLLARVAFALTTGDTRVDFSLGPLDFSVRIPGLIGISAALVCVRVVLQIGQAHLSSSTAARVMHSVRTALVRSYLRANWTLQSAEREGRLQELLTTYTVAATTAVLQLALGVVAAFSLAAFICAALIVNAVAAFAVVGAALAIGLLLHPLRKRTRGLSSRTASANLEFATAITEFTTTAQEVRVFDVEPQVRDRLEALSRASSARYQRTRFLAQLGPGIYQSTALLATVAALAIVYGTGSTELASVGAVVLITLRSLTYGQALQSSLQALHEGAPYLAALRDEELRYQAAALPSGGRPVQSIGGIRFEGVCFAYEPTVPVLRDVSFSVRHGEIIGIVGPSGSGKSTLVQLLLRLRDPSHGRMLVDGRDTAKLSIDDWYGRVTFVPQESHLFAGTIAENIRFLRDDVSDDAVEAAARRAHLHRDIESFARGYDTPVGERGGELSGGQAQRICIARALVTAPDMIVLDEPTSALDAQSEALMRETVAALAPRTTVFVIAHRLSTLSVCDRIMVFDHGRLQAFDAPSRLEEGDPFYREALRLSGMR
jgi:ABC-type multidrug transport system fused ATPase/permease subunit